MTLDPKSIDNSLGALLKYQDDIARIRGSEAARILEEVRAEMAAARTLTMAAKTGSDDPISHLSENIMQFARALRAAGLPVGPGKAIDAVER